MNKATVGLRNVAGVVVAAMLCGCVSQPVEASLCPGPVERFEVYNYYSDHPIADYHEIEDPNDITGACDYEWNHLALETRDFQPTELAQRSVTVLVLHLADGRTRTIWVHRLPGFDAGTAILDRTGESYYLRHQKPPLYYAADAHPIDRSQVPSR